MRPSPKRGAGRSVPKMLALTAVLAVVVAACARSPATGTSLTTQPPVASGGKASTTPAPARSASSGGSGSSDVRTPSAGGSTGTNRTQPHVADAPVDHGPTGGNAYWYLNRATPALEVEVDAVPGMAPSQRSLSLLSQRLHEVADKPRGIDVLPVRTVAGSETTWTDAQVAALESRYRTTHDSLQAASIYLLFVDGRSEHQGAIGVAFDSSSAVLFEQSIREAATPLITAQDIEQADVIHEVGHLLSLVNLTYTSPRNHEDPNHPGHSSDPNSVMYWAIDNVGVATLLGGHTAPPTTFDADDLADLADVRGGKLGPH